MCTLSRSFKPTASMVTTTKLPSSPPPAHFEHGDPAFVGFRVLPTDALELLSVNAT